MKNSSTAIGSRSVLAMAFVTLFAIGAGGCGISVEADVPDVVVTQHGITMGGVPAGLSGGGDLSTNLSFTQTLPDLNLPKDLDSSVKAVKVDLIAQTGIDNFDFLSSMRITMSPPGSAAPIELINYEKGDGTTGKTLSIESLNPVNILQQWKANSAVFNVQVAGHLPSQAWTMDMAVHFSGQVSYKY
jgi:hypothetical protein